MDAELLRLRWRWQRSPIDEFGRRCDGHVRIRRIRQQDQFNRTTPNNYLYRGEQYDPDLGLYYLRARYYNPLTGRFMSRDPYDGSTILPVTLHKYLYASGDAVDRIDPRGRADLFEYAIESNAAIPESKLISIYGCVADASLTAVRPYH